MLGRVDIEDFNPDAQRASLWTRQQLTPDNLAYLESLPISLVEEEKFTLVHGSPRQPVWEYILYPSIAKPNFAHFSTRFCFVDTDALTLEYHRIYYPVEVTQARMDAANLPVRLIARLSYGW